MWECSLGGLNNVNENGRFLRFFGGRFQVKFLKYSYSCRRNVDGDGIVEQGIVFLKTSSIKTHPLYAVTAQAVTGKAY